MHLTNKEMLVVDRSKSPQFNHHRKGFHRPMYND